MRGLLGRSPGSLTALAAAVALVAAIVLLGGSAEAKPLADPVVGYWKTTGWTVQVWVKPHGIFAGRLVKAARIEGCTYPAGYEIWPGFQRGPKNPPPNPDYGGFHEYRQPPTCRTDVQENALFWLGQGGSSLRFCASFGSRDYKQTCFEFTRATSVKPKPTELASGSVQIWIGNLRGIVKGPTLGPGYDATDAEGKIAFQGEDTKVLKPLVFTFNYSNDKYDEVSLRVVDTVSTSDPARAKTVVFRVVAARSGLPGCPVGSMGTLRLYDDGNLFGKSLIRDSVTLTLCGRTLTYTNVQIDSHDLGDQLVNIVYDK